ncbi:MAG: response regulator [Terriglobales bacterium]
MSSVAQAKLSVLVIEDEPSVLAFVRAALERAGYSVTTAINGAEALRLLEQSSYFGVVSDMRTPGGVDGADVHAWIAEHRPELISRVIFITGDIVNEETAATLHRTGAACVEKPFRVQQLLDVVQNILGAPQ